MSELQPETTTSSAINKENEPIVIEIPVEKKPIQKKPHIQEKLENSPKKPSTPEKLKEKQERAEQRRKEFEHERVVNAHKFVERFEKGRAAHVNNNNAPTK